MVGGHFILHCQGGLPAGAAALGSTSNSLPAESGIANFTAIFEEGHPMGAVLVGSMGVLSQGNRTTVGEHGEWKAWAAAMHGLNLDTLVTASVATPHRELRTQWSLNINQPHAAVPHKGSNSYADLMLHICEMVTATDLPNYIGACTQLPSNLCFKAWQALVCNADDTITVDCLKFGFPVGYEGRIRTTTGGYRGCFKKMHLPTAADKQPVSVRQVIVTTCTVVTSPGPITNYPWIQVTGTSSA